jgi:hypothetical protein
MPRLVPKEDNRRQASSATISGVVRGIEIWASISAVWVAQQLTALRTDRMAPGVGHHHPQHVVLSQVWFRGAGRLDSSHHFPHIGTGGKAGATFCWTVAEDDHGVFDHSQSPSVVTTSVRRIGRRADVEAWAMYQDACCDHTVITNAP